MSNRRVDIATEEALTRTNVRVDELVEQLASVVERLRTVEVQSADHWTEIEDHKERIFENRDKVVSIERRVADLRHEQQRHDTRIDDNRDEIRRIENNLR